MSKKPLVIFGAGGHAKACISTIEKQNKYKIVGYVNSKKSTTPYKYLGNDEDYISNVDRIGGHYYFIAIGDNYVRYRVYEKIRHLGGEVATIIHPSSVIADNVEILGGVIVMPSVTIQPGVSISSFCVINTASTIDHNCYVGQFSSIAPGATICGRVKIGKFSFVGAGSTVIHNIDVGNNVVIGAGSCVVSNIKENSFGYGSPYRHVRARQLDEKYL